MFLAHVKNETPNLVKAKCSLYGGPMMDYLMESGHHYTLAGLITPDVNNTIYCEMKLREKHGGFMLYDSNDTKTCHYRNGDCEWSISEDGLCMLVEDKCVMFKWDTTTNYSFRNIVSEPTKYVALDTMRHISNNP
ncbi:hypothetical protein MTR67_041700 [Solanum verrucosum]|uniref:S-protein homolog n=1 Tax=Solanum verrucosum TaxID=315347 RepID=A0AAF0UM31_SOLVR|nr:hypothetical protein MTR67_041700 [Solanum verrucosum]